MPIQKLDVKFIIIVTRMVNKTLSTVHTGPFSTSTWVLVTIPAPFTVKAARATPGLQYRIINPIMNPFTMFIMNLHLIMNLRLIMNLIIMTTLRRLRLDTTKTLDSPKDSAADSKPFSLIFHIYFMYWMTYQQ